MIVTGANSSIGEGIVREATAQGAEVVIDWVAHPEATDKIVADITSAGGTAAGCEANVGHGVRMLTRTADVELGRYGIRAVGIGPGAIDTTINADDTPAETAALRQAIPLGYIGEPVEIRKLACFVATDAASCMATTIFADGGLMQKPGAVQMVVSL